MVHLSKFDDFKKINSLFVREHEKLIKRFNIDFIFLKSVKIPVICLYTLVDVLFKNNLKIFKSTDIILLTLTASAMLSKENEENIKILLDELINRKIVGYIDLVKKVLKSIKNLSNIILKQDGLVIKNLEQFLNYKYSVQILSVIITYFRIHNIKIKDFAYWYIVDQRNKQSNELIEYIVLNYR